jgi:hypothetical protein
VIDLSDRSRTFNRDREYLLGCLCVNSYHFTLAYKLNGTTKVAALNRQNKTYWSVLRNHRRGFQQQAADTNVAAHGCELDHQVIGVNLEANRVSQTEAAELAVLWSE